jgi:hypothetical protein
LEQLRQRPGALTQAAAAIAAALSSKAVTLFLDVAYFSPPQCEKSEADAPQAERGRFGNLSDRDGPETNAIASYGLQNKELTWG